MITKEQIQELSNRNKIDQNTILREYIQLVFLKELYKEKDSQGIYFKGGTAIHLLLGGPRYSMDLDFTSEISSGSLRKLLEQVLKRMDLEIPEIGLKSSKKKTNHSFSKILIYQPKEGKYPLNILLDFSSREKPLKEIQKKILGTDFPIIGLPVILHLDWQEILAEKIRAILVRGKGRDLYDLFYLLVKNIPIDWELAQEKMEIYSKKIRREANIQTLRKAIEVYRDSDLKKDLSQFLPKSERDNILPILKEELIKGISEK